MNYFLSIFAGRKGLGNDKAFRSSLRGRDVEAHHRAACATLGLKWSYVYDDGFGFTAEQAAPLLADPTLALLLSEDAYDNFTHELVDDVGFQDFYMHVATWGARRVGVDLQWEPLEADEIDAGGEIFGAVQ